ncbi:hypothetical protein DM02DRAFT_544625 [Periconia macrospinosa]|uniref:Uncharacterized protein n=1 Tax=Periconia macrospinosa TaxID=97972 RepID=A0A2V1D1T4_9PLEO|nr:hypothetical protein DM02DRAFT_544625 [Periconia macrospinosa]
MKLLLLSLLGWSYIQLSSTFPIDDTPAFTPWPLEKRLIPSEVFSNPLGPQFAVHDETCRGKLSGDIGRCFRMNDVTVDKFIENRAPKTKDCNVPCLFYTQGLSGAAEREGNFVLRQALNTAATEGPRKYQTIWDLHDEKYYPNFYDLDKTPESKCIALDREENDEERGHDSCQRLYFKAMSKAMAMECSGEVFMMTSSELRKKHKTPENGIWWQVEFPTLIDGNRPADKKVTKVMPNLKKKEVDALSPEERSKPPKILHEGEYWPNGVGRDQLEGKLNEINLDTTEFQPRSSMTDATLDLDPPMESVTGGLIKRAEFEDAEVLELGDEGYPYPYSIDDIYKWYQHIAW